MSRRRKLAIGFNFMAMVYNIWAPIFTGHGWEVSCFLIPVNIWTMYHLIMDT